MPTATDEQLIIAAKNDRCRSLTRLYEEMAETTRCYGRDRCADGHQLEDTTCPKGIWQNAARMAAMSIIEH